MADIELITVHDPADCEEAEVLIRRLRAELERVRAAIVDQWVTGGDFQCALCLSYADTREAVEHDADCIMVAPSGED